MIACRSLIRFVEKAISLQNKLSFDSILFILPHKIISLMFFWFAEWNEFSSLPILMWQQGLHVIVFRFPASTTRGVWDSFLHSQKNCFILILHSMLSCNCIKFSLVLNSFLSLKLFYFLQQGQNAYHCLSCNFMMSGRKKKICLADHSMEQQKMNSIWRPIATNASSYEGLSILSQDILIFNFSCTDNFALWL